MNGAGVVLSTPDRVYTIVADMLRTISQLSRTDISVRELREATCYAVAALLEAVGHLQRQIDRTANPTPDASTTFLDTATRATIDAIGQTESARSTLDAGDDFDRDALHHVLSAVELLTRATESIMRELRRERAA